MCLYSSSKQFDDFLNDPGARNYEKYRSDLDAAFIFDWLKARLDWMIASIKNHRKPALQGVIVDLEDLLIERLGWSAQNKDNFFITMIGAMVRFLVEENGFVVKRTGVPLRLNRIISTAAIYQPM